MPIIRNAAQTAAMNGKGLNVPKVLGPSDDPQLGQSSLNEVHTASQR